MTRRAILAVFLLLFCSALAVHAYETENVFVVVIDGLRNEEAFDDPDHQFIPHIWNDLRPEGTIYTEFYNDFQTTYTTPGHEAIVTGQWHFHPNLKDGARFGDARPEAPTIFEYFRYHTGLPQGSSMVVTGKDNNIRLDWSLEPAYGPYYSALMFKGGNDDQTYALLAEKLADHKPNLVLVNLRTVDNMGHTGDWNAYTDAIINADSLVYRIWTELIQGDEDYMDTTTMIVTSDHGRNDDNVGFKDHGGMSHSNRHVLFLALGPDTPENRSISERRYLIDIAATVGELLGFPTPFSHGQVMTGIFHSYLNSDPRIRVYRKNPRIATFSGAVFVVWSENDSDDMGNERVYLMHKYPGEQSFTDPVLINDPPVARWAFYPSVTANIQGLHVVWLDGRTLDGINDSWSIYYRRSPDWGGTWEDEKPIVTSTFEWEDAGLEVVAEPEIMSTRLGELIVTVRFKGWSKKITSFRSTDKGKTWKEFEVDPGNAFPRQYSPIELSKPNEVAIAWIEMALTPGETSSYNWEIFFKRSVNGAKTWNNLNRLTYHAGYSDRPKLACSGENLITVWADRDVSGAPWKLYVRSSEDKGKKWGQTENITTGPSAWEPSVVWNAGRDEFYLVWTDYESDLPDLKASRSNNGLIWGAIEDVIDNPGGALRRNPQVGCTTDGSLHMVWEELDSSTGDWEIKTTTLY